jgi:hypothetical protein
MPTMTVVSDVSSGAEVKSKNTQTPRDSMSTTAITTKDSFKNGLPSSSALARSTSENMRLQNLTKATFH